MLEILTKTQEIKLTTLQAKEFLEERRGIVNPTEIMLENFVDHIYQFEIDFGLKER